MKKLSKSLFALMLMLGTMLEMKAADVAPGYYLVGNFFSPYNNNSSLKFEITAKRLYAASQRVL